MKGINKIIISLIATSLIIAGLALYKSSQSPHIAYVRSADLVYGFEGMKEAQATFEKKKKELESNIDTLRIDFQRSINRYNVDYKKLSEIEKVQQEEILTKQENSLNQYTKSVTQRVKKDEESMTQGVLNQINSFVEQYGQEKKYDIILGTTNSGNLLYGVKYMDITEDVLKALNEQFRGKNKAQE